MTILDFAYIGAHFLWIFGLSLILAAFSYLSWLGREMRRPFSALFSESSWNVALNVGLSLMVLSITVMPRSERWFIRLVALIAALIFASFGARSWWQTRNSN
jgi:hypothetical protein